MIEIKTDWTFQNTHVFLDGEEMRYVTGFRILMNVAEVSRVEITKYKDKNGLMYAENLGSPDAFIPVEILTFSDFKLTLI